MQLLNCKWIPTKRNTSKITVVIEIDIRRLEQMELCLKALWCFDQSKKVPQSCLCLWQQRKIGAALIPPPWASNPKLGSKPLELGSKEFLFPELFQSNRKYIRRWWGMVTTLHAAHKVMCKAACTNSCRDDTVEKRIDLFPAISRAISWNAVKFLFFFSSL